MTLLKITQLTTQVVQKLTKDVTFIKKHVLGKGITNNDDDSNI